MTLVDRLGAHGLIWANGWSSEEAELTLRGAAEAGLHHVEVPLFDPWSLDADHTRGLLGQLGLAATGSLALGPDTDVSSTDRSVVDAGRRQLMKALEAAHAIGSAYLCGVYYSALCRYPGPPSTAGRANSVAVVGEAAQRARELGMTLVLEVVNRYETNLLNTAEDALRFIDDTGQDNIAVHLDTYHMNMHEKNMSRPVRACRDRLGYVHIRESTSGYLGSGTVDFAEFFAALEDIGFDGLATFEAFTYSRCSAEIRDLLCVWADTWSDPDHLVRHARDFVAVNT